MTDAELYRRKVGTERRYFDPLPPCPLNEAPDADVNLVNVTGITSTWQGQFKKRVHGYTGPLDAHRAAAWAVANLNVLQANLPEEGHIKIVRAAKADLDAAMDRGTAVHEMIEDELTGQPRLIASDKGDAYRDTVLDLIAWLDPQAVIVEAVALAPTEGYGGTFDAIITSEVLGGTFLIDWKTRGADSKHKCYPKEVAQLGLLAAAEYYIANGERHEMPRLDGCAVVSIKPDSFEVYPVDLDGAIKAGERALETYKAKVSGEAEAEAAIGKAFTRKVDIDDTPRSQRIVEQLPAIKDEAFILRWRTRLPGIAGPKRHNEWTDQQCNQVEREFELTFTDPTQPVAPYVDHQPTPPPAPAPVDTGGPYCDPTDTTELRALWNRRGTIAKQWTSAWHLETIAAGLTWRMKRDGHITVQSYEQSRAAYWLSLVAESCAGIDTPLEDVERCIRTVGVTITNGIGTTLANMTTGQATECAAVAQAVIDGQVKLTDDGLFQVAA